MIPKVQVPMDFGVKYLGSPSHSNLKFCLANGAELLANSMIISYNSPVIERITTELFQTTIDVEEFTKEVVQCFLEGSYSGELKNVSKFNFRDVNKMVHVFEVSWMVERSLEYFKSLVEEVSEENYEDQLYVFEEAMFVLITLKKRNFVDLVIERFTSLLSCRQFFVTQYLTVLSTFSTTHLDVIIEMTRKQEYILMEVLVRHLEKNKSCFDSNSRYLLQNVSFTSCRATHNSLYQQFFDILRRMENPSREDFSLIIKLLKQSDQALSNVRESNLQFAKIPNLFHEFKLIKDFSKLDELVNFLVDSPLVTNSYIFIDAVFCWLMEKENDDGSPYITISDTFVERFACAMSKNGWGPLALEYIRNKKSDYLGGLTEKIMENEKLTTKMYSCISSIAEYYSPDEFFLNDHDIKFQFKHKSISNCNKAGDCGFILRVTAATDELGDSFDVRLIIDPNLYPTDIHFHDDAHSFVDMHLALKFGNKWLSFPVTWYGQPRRDGFKNYWMWGPYRFYKQDDDVHRPPGDNYRCSWFRGSDAKIRPVVYYFG